jgi:hypothetical protein
MSTTTLRTPVQLQFRDVASVPASFQVYLLDIDRAKPVDMRAAASYAFTPAGDVSRFRLIVGTPEAVKSKIDELVPKAFALDNNFPNPFNPQTTIPVSVPFASEIHLTIYNILGAEVRTLFAGPVDAGRYWFRWDGTGNNGNPVASGIYLVRMTTSRGLTFVRKMALIR